MKLLNNTTFRMQILAILIAGILFPGNLFAQVISEDIEYVLSYTEGCISPLRMVSGNDGILYVADAGTNSILSYDASGSFLETIQAVNEPVSVAVNGRGDLFIGDAASGYIFKLNQVTGTAEEFFTGTIYPSSLVISPDDILYVSDSKLQAVLAVDISGNVLDTIGMGTLDFPTGIAYDANRERILVGEHGGSGFGFKPVVRVYVFDRDGNEVDRFGSHGSGDGQFYRVQGLTVGRCGNYYVADPFQGRISIFNPEGNFITKFGDFGLDPGQMNIPMDVVFDESGRVVVTSMNNGAIELFSISDSLPSSEITGGTAMICAGETTDIQIEFTGTAPWTFTYTVDGLNPTVINTSENPYILSVSDAGLYEVTAVSDANYEGTCFTGCADIVVTDSIPTAVLSGDAVICRGESTNLSVSFTGQAPWNFTYSRDDAEPVSVLTTNNPYIFPVSETGLYDLMSISGAGCTGTDLSGSAMVEVKPLPTAEILEGNAHYVIDSGTSMDLHVELTGEGPWTISRTIDDEDTLVYSDISASPFIITASEAGTYEVKEVSDTWCYDDESLGYPEIVLKSPDPPPTSSMDGGVFSICPGEYQPIHIQFTGTPPWTFSYMVDTLMTTTIFNTYTNPYIINAIYTGTYKVIALSDSKYVGNEFIGEASVQIHPYPVPDFEYITDELQVSFNNLSVHADSYVWDFGDGNSSIEMNPVHEFQSPGEYFVSLTASESSCGNSIVLVDTVSVTTTQAVGIEFGDIVNIYPNPSNGFVTIEVEDPDRYNVCLEIIGAGGQKVYFREFSGPQMKETLNLEAYAEGVYFVKIISGKDLWLKKLILNRK